LILNSVIILAANTAFVGLLGAIEGFERYSFRLLVTVSGSISLIASSYMLIPRFGTVAISLCFMIQSVVNVLAAAFILRTLVPRGGPMGLGFSLLELRRMAKIGIPIRLGGLVNLTYEPVTRLLIVKFGGIGSAGTYEAAVRCGIQAKALIAGCIQVVLPRFSALAASNVDAFRGLLQFAYKITGLLVAGALPLILLSTPLISFALLGRLDGKFQLFAEILSVGWLINVLAVPTSFANLADGRLFWTWFANVCAAVINPAMGLILGRALGAKGVVIATGCALVSMSAITLVARRLTAKDRIPLPGPRTVALVVVAIALVAVRLFISDRYDDTFTSLSASLVLSTLFAVIWLAVSFSTLRQMLHEAGVGEYHESSDTLRPN
jgi:O-antigen/teichoic acid export membrane protein